MPRATDQELALEEDQELRDESKFEVGMMKGFTVQTGIGSGGFGALYRVRRDSDYATYIIKLVYAGTDITDPPPRLDAPVMREIDFLMRLKHPNVMSGLQFEIVKDNSMASILMPLMGGDLTNNSNSRIPKNRIRFSFERRVTIFQKILCGLRYLHDNFIIHCDLKPQNILMDQKSLDVRITDFGTSVNMGASMKVLNEGTRVSENWRPMELWNFEGVKCKPPYFGTGVDIYGLGLLGLWLVFDINPLMETVHTPFKLQGKPSPAMFDLFILLGFQTDLGVDPDYERSERDEDVQFMLNIIGNPKDYFQRNAINIEALPKAKNFLNFVLGMCRPKEAERPTATELLNTFPKGIVNPLDFEDGCLNSKIEYPEVSIRYTDWFTPKMRQELIDRISTVTEKSDEMTLMAIDLLDQVGSNLSSEGIDEDILVITVIMIAAAVFGEDFEPEGVAELLDIDYPSGYGEGSSSIIELLKGRMYRPTLDMVSGIGTEEALKIAKEYLSPSNVIFKKIT